MIGPIVVDSKIKIFKTKKKLAIFQIVSLGLAFVLFFLFYFLDLKWVGIFSFVGLYIIANIFTAIGIYNDKVSFLNRYIVDFFTSFCLAIASFYLFIKYKGDYYLLILALIFYLALIALMILIPKQKKSMETYFRVVHGLVEILFITAIGYIMLPGIWIMWLAIGSLAILLRDSYLEFQITMMLINNLSLALFPLIIYVLLK
ncbi:MAG TPA: hypothetical protein GXZ51_03105 [Acholeplasma sp.]|nr:hypothetical protein [Acholeplasma sp.]